MIAFDLAGATGLEPRDTLLPFARGVYVNQVGDTSVRSAYGTNYARLVEIQEKVHPNNGLRLNQNIKADNAPTG